MGPSGTVVPKGVEKKPPLTAKKLSGDKPIQANKPEPLYPLIGTKRVAFLKVARALSEVLHLTYGDEMSITKFGRILVELRGQNSLRGLVFLEQKTLDMFLAYEKSKQEMIEEQNLFRSSYSTPSVRVPIPDKISNIFDAEIHPSAATIVAGLPESFREDSGTRAHEAPQ
jgi:hypothetical protein